MSDILLVGKDFELKVGEEFFLHSGDWWYEILAVINGLPKDSFPVEKYFYRDLMLTPPTPHLDVANAMKLSDELEKFVETGEARTTLMNHYNTDEIMVDYFDGDEEAKEYCADERMEQIENMVDFLRASGGCHAKWYTGDEDDKWYEDVIVPDYSHWISI